MRSHLNSECRRSSTSFRALALLATVISLAPIITACSNRGPTDESPEGALQLFLSAMRSRDRAAAYELLAPASQQVLRQRAEQATEQGGRDFDPADMLAVERFVMRWDVRDTEASIRGEEATVTVTGESEAQRAEVELRNVDGHWRVLLPID